VLRLLKSEQKMCISDSESAMTGSKILSFLAFSAAHHLSFRAFMDDSLFITTNCSMFRTGIYRYDIALP